MDRTYTAKEAAEHYHTTEETLKWWRYKGTGPRWFRAGKRVLYRESDIAAWDAAQVEKQAASA